MAILSFFSVGPQELLCLAVALALLAGIAGLIVFIVKSQNKPMPTAMPTQIPTQIPAATPTPSNCPHCGQVIAPGSTTCPQCGVAE